MVVFDLVEIVKLSRVPSFAEIHNNEVTIQSSTFVALWLLNFRYFRHFRYQLNFWNAFGATT